MRVTIYHNPKCSKSCQTLALLQENGIEPEVVEYMSTPLNAAELKSVLSKLGLGPRDILRSKEAKEEGIEQLLDGNDIIAAITTHPRAMQRPIVVKGDKAVIGRPPENVLEIL